VTNVNLIFGRKEKKYDSLLINVKLLSLSRKRYNEKPTFICCMIYV
jgi:hypothetical protein